MYHNKKHHRTNKVKNYIYIPNKRNLCIYAIRYLYDINLHRVFVRPLITVTS